MSTDAAQPDFDTIDAGPGDGSGGDGRKGRKRLLTIAGTVVALGLVGVGAYAMMRSGDDSRTQVVEQAPPVFFELPEMTVNLSSLDERPRFLRVRISLEMQDEETRRAVAEVEPRVLDAFQVYLRELRATDLEGSAGIYRLKEELVRRVNLAIHPAGIDNVVFEEIIVQ